MASAEQSVAKTDYVKTMFDAFSQGDIEAFKACMAPGAVVWHNNDEAEQDVAGVCASIAYLQSRCSSLSYIDQRIVADGNLYFIQHVLTGDLKSGGVFRLPAMMRVETNSDGLVARIEEYFDSRATDCLA